MEFAATGGEAARPLELQWPYSVVLAAPWGGAEQQTSIFRALTASLADPSLPPLPNDIRQLIPSPTLAHLADVQRLAKTNDWRGACGETNQSRLTHQATWLLLDGHGLGLPSPRLLGRGESTTSLTDTWKRNIVERMEKDVGLLWRREKCSKDEAWALVAHRRPWNVSLADLQQRTAMFSNESARTFLKLASASADGSPATDSEGSQTPRPTLEPSAHRLLRELSNTSTPPMRRPPLGSSPLVPSPLPASSPAASPPSAPTPATPDYKRLLSEEKSKYKEAKRELKEFEKHATSQFVNVQACAAHPRTHHRLILSSCLVCVRLLRESGRSSTMQPCGERPQLCKSKRRQSIEPKWRSLGESKPRRRWRGPLRSMHEHCSAPSRQALQAPTSKPVSARGEGRPRWGTLQNYMRC